MTYEWSYTYGSPMAVAPLDKVRQVLEYVEIRFDDVRSLQAKFDLLKEFKLRGPSYWQLMRWFRANWLLLQDNFYIAKE